MKCARCGSEIANGSSRCPSCGLRVRTRPPSSVLSGEVPSSQEVNHPPSNPQDRPPIDKAAMPETQPGDEEHPTLQEKLYRAPGDAYAYPDEEIPEARPEYPLPEGEPEKGVFKSKTSKVVAISVAALLLVVGGAAFAYFKYLTPKSTAETAASIITSYANALGKGDAEKVKALHAPGMEPQAGEVEIACGAMKMLGITYSFDEMVVDITNEKSDEMEVEIVDYTLTMAGKGFKETGKLNDFPPNSSPPADKPKVKLKKINGKWLINQKEIANCFPQPSPDPSPPAPSGT
ncbi:MAG: hypothetical protein PHO53_07010 [Actinomycetota bacterium]|nr:hypothetical protein [Actinomycetota bacterium]